MFAAIKDGPSDLPLTITMFPRCGKFTATGMEGEPTALVRTGPATDGPARPLRLAAIEHQRPLSTTKQVGEAIKTHYLGEFVCQGL